MTQYRKPPWPGNQIATVHGARSELRLGPLKEQIVAEILTDPASPPYLQDPSYRLALDALGRVTAIITLLWGWLLQQDDVQALLSDTTETTETEDRNGGTVTRRSLSRRVESVLGQIRQYEVTAQHMRSKLGLDPSSRSKMASRFIRPQLDLALLKKLADEDGDSEDDGESRATAVTDGSESVLRPPAGKSV